MPGRALSGVIAHLKVAMPDSHQLLDTFHQNVVAYLKAMSSDEAQNAAGHELQTRLHEQLADLKSLGLASKTISTE